MGYDKFFGFDLQQRKTLQALLAEVAAGDTSALEALQAEVDALDIRVTAIETELEG